MATGNVTPRRKRGRVAEKTAERKYRHKLGKTCPHPDCGKLIDDTATTCAAHKVWYQNGGQGSIAKQRFIRSQFDRAMDAGVLIAKIQKRSKRWYKMERDAIEAEAQALVSMVD